MATKKSVEQAEKPEPVSHANAVGELEAMVTAPASAPSVPHVYRGIHAVRSKIVSIRMTGHNKHDDYAYMKLADIVRSLAPLVNEANLIIVMENDEAEMLPDRITSKGGTNYAWKVRVRLRLISAVDGSEVSVVSYGEGQDRADKSIYKAITGARKYALLSAFGLATGDDVEADERVGLETAAESGAADMSIWSRYADAMHAWNGKARMSPEEARRHCTDIFKARKQKVTNEAVEAVIASIAARMEARKQAAPAAMENTSA